MLLDTVVYTIANGNFLGAFLSFMISAPLEAKTVEAAGSKLWHDREAFTNPGSSMKKTRSRLGIAKKSDPANDCMGCRA